VSELTLSIENLTERDITKTIDHSLLRPELGDAFIEAGWRLVVPARADAAGTAESVGAESSSARRITRA
jgi:hypothetical protein